MKGKALFKKTKMIARTARNVAADQAKRLADKANTKKTKAQAPTISFNPDSVVIEENGVNINEVVFEKELKPLWAEFFPDDSHLKLKYTDQNELAGFIRCIGDLAAKDNVKTILQIAPNALVILATLAPAKLIECVNELMSSYRDYKDVIRASLSSLMEFCEDKSLLGPLYRTVFSKCIDTHRSTFLPEVRRMLVGEQAQYLEAYAGSCENFLPVAALMAQKYDKLTDFEKSTWQRHVIQALLTVERSDARELQQTFDNVLELVSTDEDVFSGILLALRQLESVLSSDNISPYRCLRFFVACHQNKKARNGLTDEQFDQFVEHIVRQWKQQTYQDPVTPGFNFSLDAYNLDNELIAGFVHVLEEKSTDDTLKGLPLEFFVAISSRKLFLRTLVAKIGLTVSAPLNDRAIVEQLFSVENANRFNQLASIEALANLVMLEQSTMLRENKAVWAAREQTFDILAILSRKFLQVKNVEEHYHTIGLFLGAHVEYWATATPQNIIERVLVVRTLVEKGQYLEAAKHVNTDDDLRQYFTGKPYRFENIKSRVDQAKLDEEQRIRQEKHEEFKQRIADDYSEVFQYKDYMAMLKEMVEYGMPLEMEHIRKASEYFDGRPLQIYNNHFQFAQHFGLLLVEKLKEGNLSDDDVRLIRGMLLKCAALRYSGVNNPDSADLVIMEACHPLLVTKLQSRRKLTECFLLDLVVPSEEDRLNDGREVNEFYSNIVPGIFQCAVQKTKVRTQFLTELLNQFDQIQPQLLASGTTVHLRERLVGDIYNKCRLTADEIATINILCTRLALIDRDPTAINNAVSIFLNYTQILAGDEYAYDAPLLFTNFVTMLMLHDELNEEQRSQVDAAVNSVLGPLLESLSNYLQHNAGHIYPLNAIDYLSKLIPDTQYGRRFADVIKPYVRNLLEQDLVYNGRTLRDVSDETYSMLYRNCGDEELQVILCLHGAHNLLPGVDASKYLKEHLTRLSQGDVQVNAGQAEQPNRRLTNFCGRMMRLGGREFLRNIAFTVGPLYFQEPCMRPLMREYCSEYFKGVLTKLYTAYVNSYGGKSGKVASILQRKDARKTGKLNALQEIFDDGHVFDSIQSIADLVQLARQVCDRDVYQHASRFLTTKKAQIVGDMEIFLSMMENFQIQLTRQEDNPFMLISATEVLNFKSHGYGSSGDA